MKVAIVTDLHWGVRNNNLFFLEQQEKFFYSVFFPYLEEHHISKVWILGDFFENRKMINVQIMNKASLFLEHFEKRNIDVYCLIGNHDAMFKNTNEVTSLIPLLKSFSNVKIIQKFEEFDFEGLRVGFVSWIAPDVRDECVEWLRSTTSRVICGHFEINSFEIIKGVVCNNGLEPSLFERFDHVFSGHFHIRSSNGIIQYLGNPYQTNWGEADYEKGFHIFDTQSKKIEFVKNPNQIYKIIRITDRFDFKKFDVDLCRQKIVRIISETNKNKKQLESLIESIGSVCQSIELIENKEVIVDDLDNPMITDTAGLIKQFLDSCQIVHLDKNLLQNMIFDIYKESVEKAATSC